MLEELAPGRRGEEQVAHHHAGAGRAGGGGDVGELAALDADFRGVGGVAGARDDVQAGGGADGGQRLAAEAECRDAHQIVVGELRCGVAQHREGQAVGVHADAVVGHLDAVDAAAVERHGDARGAGVERVLHQLLHGGGGALDHLAGGDAVDGVLGENANRGHVPGAFVPV